MKWDVIFLLLILISVSHTNIIRYCNRPFANTEEMNYVLIKNWNETVSPEDTVYMLGDFALGRMSDVKNIVSQLNGHKILIMGNHDHGRPNQYLEAGFEKVVREKLVLPNRFILTHHPLDEQDASDLPNLYGHIHDNVLSTRKNSLCVCVERTNYRPISYDEVMNRLNT